MRPKRRKLKPIVPIIGGRPLTSDSSTLTTTTAQGLHIRPTATTSSKVSKKIHKVHTQKLISTYHTLTKRLAYLLKKGDEEGAEKVRRELEGLGGLNAYQQASLKGGDERRGKGACGRWLVGRLGGLREMVQSLSEGGGEVGKEEGKRDDDDDDDDDSDDTQGKHPSNNSDDADRNFKKKKKRMPKPKLKLLDVGALNGETYAKQSSWIETTSIDLNPQHPNVQQQDFFERPVPTSDSEKFHVLCFSLVVNFVGDPAKRGQMLLHATHFLHPSGLLFLVLPLPCVTNSRYTTQEHLNSLMRHLGFEAEPVDVEYTKKLAMCLYRYAGQATVVESKKEDVVGGKAEKQQQQQKKKKFGKRELNPGPGRNNFAIVLE
ncbi:hypothetical protein HDV05_006595 [Chytridiales sp. JEL 0842]|nr:hypothetical protein HDV05_006595 [Chytridiales sp. JEL 0842]